MFDYSVFEIAYSDLGKYVRNSMPHFKMAAETAFTALKGDVRITADGKLIMCHDKGYTFGADGKVTAFDKNNFRPFLEMSYEEVRSCVLGDSKSLRGMDSRPVSFEEFAEVCKDSGKYIYATVRDNRIPEVIAAVFETVRRLGMEDRLIVNSFTYEALEEVRKYSRTVPVSHVQRLWKVLDEETVRNAAKLLPACITMFSFPDKNGDAFDIVEASMPAIRLALDLGLEMHMAQVETAEERKRLMDLGFTGMQIKDIIPLIGEKRTR